MQVRHGEGVANHTDPLSCVAREVSGEALAGESIGQPLSRERFSTRVPTPLPRKATVAARYARRPIPRGQRPWHVQTLLEREPGDLTRDRRLHTGPHREGEEP